MEPRNMQRELFNSGSVVIQIVLLEFRKNLALLLERSFPNPIPIGSRERSSNHYCQIDSNSQRLMQFPG